MSSRVRHLDRRCPRCGYVQSASRPDCRRCDADPRRPSVLRSLRDWALAPSDTGTTGLLATILVIVLMLWIGVPSAFRSPVTAGQQSPTFAHQLVQMANLVFHEAGHWILAPLGDFMAVLGGSLVEVLIPLICAAAFVRQGDRRGAAFGIWWTGQALTGVAVYAADARAGRLVLLGGRTGRDSPGFHDWHNLLQSTGLLAWDHSIAWALHLSAVLLMTAGIGWCAALIASHTRAEARSVPAVEG